MKNTTLLTFFIFSFCYSLCQVPDWQKMMIEPNAKFNDIVNEVTPYLEEHEAEFEAEAEGSPLSPENFTRWQNFWIDRVSDGTETNAGSFRIAKNNTVNSPTCNSANGSNWTCVGPFFSTARQGIVIASSFDPDDASNNTLYIGTKFSGIWKTTNAQAALPTWRCLQDGTGLPPIGVSGIAVLPISGGIKKIYAGSGTSFSYGTGLYESLNGGATWTVITTLNILDRPILKLLVEPVAIPTYLFIMTNKEILKMNMATHAVTNLYTYSPQLCSWWSSLEDMCFDPNNSNKLYVTSTGFNPQLVDEFWEHCGSPLPGVSTPLNSYVNWQEGSPVSYFSSSTDQPIVESTSPSSSGGGNIYLDNLNTSDREFTISGFNSSSYTNLSLTFECKRLTINSDPLTVEFSIDGITWTQLSVSIPVNTTWNPISPTGLLPSTSNLRLRFSKSTTSEFRIDNIKMTNTKCAGMNSVMKKIDLTTTLVTDITPSISNVMSIRLSSCPLPANNNNIYAFCHQEIGSSKYYHTIIYNGTSWSSAVSQSANGVFDEAYQVSPKDPTVMYTAGITLFKITNSGSVITPASTASDDFTHADIRTILIEPGSSTTDRVWIGTDGGVSFSAVGAGVGTWSSKNGTGLNNTEFYGLAVTEGDQHFINGGAQDNHQYLYFHGNWINWGNGDGYHSLIYPKTTSANPYFVIGEASSGGSNFDYSYGNIFFERDQPTGPPRAISVPNQPSREDRPIHEFDNKIYTGYVDIFEATPPNLSTWTQKTNFFGNNTNLRAAMRQFYVSKNSSNPSLKTGYILFQYQDYSSTGIVLGALFKNTVDITDQSQWIDISNDIRIDNGGGPFNILQRTALVITDFTVDPNNFDRIWLTCSGFGQNRVIYSPDGGATWSDFSSGLSSWPVNCIIYQENSNDALYIGTDAGVFYRNSSMTQWQCYDEHLPVCVVKDLEINYCYQKLRAATFGRAIWESDLAPSPSTISTGVTNWTTDRKITNDIVIPSGATLTISANINIAKGRKITVKSGGVLILNSPAHLFNGCQEMWDGVYGESGSTINVRNSTIEHAYQAFNLKDQCSYVFEGNTFDANYISIKLGDNSMRHSVIGSMIGNHFHCNSNLPPYFGTAIPGLTPNTKSYCGIYIYNVDLSSFGKTGAAPNNFSNMESGIVSYYSNLTLTNASFSNLHDHNHYRINFGGCGIYSQSGGNYLLKYVSGASFSGPDFSDCYEGIKIENQNFSIFGCSFDKMNTGIEVKNCRGITGSITDNILKCSDRGIVLLKNDFAKSILAIRNNIEIAKDLTTTRAGAYGIGVLELGNTFKTPHINLISNTINIFYGLKGIYALSSDHLIVTTNSIFLNQNNNNIDLPNETINGIEINGCNGALVYRNNILGSDYSDGSTQYGIESNINIGTENYFSCNTISSTLRNMNFGGGLMTCTLQGNDLGNAYEGLHITSSCAIGSQFHGGNCFSGTFGNPDGAAINMNTDPTFLAWSAIYVNDAIPSCYLPSNNHPFGDWFMSDQSQNEYSCTIPECNPCDESIIKSIDNSIANNEYGSMLYNDQVNWEGKKYLMEKLAKYPDLLTSNSLLQSFYDNYENTNVDKINHIGFGILTFNQMTSLQAIQFHCNDSIIEIIRDSLSTLYINLSNSLLETEKLAIISQINLVNSQMRLLELENKSIATIFSTSKDQNADQVKMENSAIVANINIEQNIKIVNDIYLQTMAKGIDEYSESMKTDLYNIAILCPYEGGPAVYTARSMYYTIQPDLVFNDKYNCAQLGYYRSGNSNSEELPIDSRVIPNPVRSFAKLEYTLPENTEGRCRIYNSAGQLVQELVLSSSVKSQEIITGNFRNSIYHYIIYVDNNVVSNGSFSVSK